MHKGYLSAGLACALMAGVCLSADGSGGGSGGAADRPALIRSALSTLDTSKDTDWTNAGLPSMEKMKELTGLDDLTRKEVGEASPGFERTNTEQKPGETAGATPSQAEGDKSELELADERRAPNLDPRDNPNVGKDAGELGAYEGQTHAADQGEYLGEQVAVDLWTEGKQPADLAKGVKDPVFLIEAAVAAFNADERYSKNGELRQFFNHYSIAQVNIKTHQARLNKRYEELGKNDG